MALVFPVLLADGRRLFVRGPSHYLVSMWLHSNAVEVFGERATDIGTPVEDVLTVAAEVPTPLTIDQLQRAHIESERAKARLDGQRDGLREALEVVRGASTLTFAIDSLERRAGQ